MQFAILFMSAAR